MSINEVRWLSECGSTNAYAKEHFEEFGPVGAVYTTNQTAGRGRLGRSWVNAEGRALYYTAVIREPLAQPATLPLLASLAVRDQLAQRYGVDCQIKWPNDLLLQGKKVCGILSEMQLNENGSIDYAIVGIGVNVDLNPQDFPEDLRNTAASLNASFGKNYKCTEVLSNILQEFAVLYQEWLEEGAQVILEPWKELNCTLNRRVFVKDNDEVIFSGEVVAINEAGAIIVRNEEGESQSFDFGEISIRY